VIEVVTQAAVIDGVVAASAPPSTGVSKLTGMV